MDGEGRTDALVLHVVQDELAGDGLLDGDGEGGCAWEVAVRPVVVPREIIRSAGVSSD